MSPSNTSSQDAGREPSVRVVRRQLVTAHGTKEPTPRVVLHLPDLDALQTVALGPVRPSASRRRIDAAHDVEPTAKRSGGKQAAKVKSGDESEEAPASPLLNLLRIPVNKWLSPGGAGPGKFSLGSLVVMMQQPKVMLGTVLAVAMQLAAILAMLGGGTTDKSTNHATTPAGGDHMAHTHDSVPHGPQRFMAFGPSGTDQRAASNSRPIQTPLSVQADGRPFAGPSLLPAPQALAGVDAKDVPPWQAPVTSLPQPSGVAGPARAEAIAAPKAPPTAAPIFSGPTSLGPSIAGPTDFTPSPGSASSLGTGNLVIARPDGSNTAAGNTPDVSTGGPTNVVQTSGARAKLKGTIQRKASGAN